MATHVGRLSPDNESQVPAIRPSWMASRVFTTHGVGWDSSSAITGTHTSTQPITAQAAIAHSGKKVISFADDFYNRVIIDPSYVDAGNLVSEQFYEISVFNGYFATSTLQSLTTQDADGMQITGPTLPATFGPLETKKFYLTISTDGPPTIAAKLFFDFGGTSDDITIDVVGARIVMLPYQAETPWVESLEWRTNILLTNDGTEQRVRLRKNARQSTRASYPVPSEKLAQALNMAYGWIERAWAVGLWSETQYIGSIAQGVTAISCDTTTYDFRKDGLVCIWESHAHNEVVEIEDVFSNSLSLKRVLANGYDTAIIMPVRIGMVTGSISRDTNGYRSSLGIEYQFKDNIDLAPSAPTQYGGYDIYFDETLMASDTTSDKIITRQDVVDFETGVVEYFPPWTHNRIIRNAYFLNENPLQSWNFKKWLHRRAGRLRPYWLPTFEDNLRVIMNGNVASSITCQADDYRTIGYKHDHIAIEFNNGTWIPCHVTGVSTNNAALINVAIDVTLNVDASTIKRVSFLTLNRLDTDRVEIEWIGGGVNQSTIRILEFKP